MKRLRWIYFALALACMLVTAGLLTQSKAHQKLGLPGVKMDLPRHVLQYLGAPTLVNPEEVGGLPPDTSLARTLYTTVEAGKTNSLQLTIVLMGSDRTSIHKPQFCLVGQGWRIDQTDATSIPILQPHPYALPMMRLTATKLFQTAGGRVQALRAIYAYWFVADHQLTQDHGQRMWWMAKQLILTGVLQRWAYVSCFAVCLPGEEDATFERMSRFLAAAVPEFQLTTGPLRTAARIR